VERFLNNLFVILCALQLTNLATCQVILEELKWPCCKDIRGRSIDNTPTVHDSHEMYGKKLAVQVQFLRSQYIGKIHDRISESKAGTKC